jgi:hypothetical protein
MRHFAAGRLWCDQPIGFSALCGVARFVFLFLDGDRRRRSERKQPQVGCFADSFRICPYGHIDVIGRAAEEGIHGSIITEDGSVW